MVIGQPAGRSSLRDIVDNLSTQRHRLYHPGSAQLSRCNLSRINEDKPYTPSQALFGMLLERCQGLAPRHHFRFNSPLCSLDASTIDLCLSNAKTRVLERRPVVAEKGLTSDQTIEFTGAQTAKKCPIPLRRIGYHDLQTGKHYIFLTNNFTLAAEIIADIYRAWWQMKLFFKWIKQNLKIKSFIGTSKNAVITQIWIALCVYLLLAFLKFHSKLKISLQQVLRLLQLNLFERRDFTALLQ